MSSFSLRDQNILSPVRDQEDEGTCTAFALTAGASTAVAKVYHMSVEFSKQHLVDHVESFDFDPEVGDFESSNLPIVLEYARNVGLLLETDYREYDGTVHPSTFDAARIVFRLHQYRDITMEPYSTRETCIREEIVVAEMTSYRSFLNFVGQGVYKPTHREYREGSQEKHAVQIIGYGKEGARGMHFYEIQNSHGLGHRHEGFAKVARSLFTSLYVIHSFEFPVV